MSNRILANLASLLRNEDHAHLRDKFVPTYRIPEECSKKELLEFQKLVLVAGKVNKHALPAGVQRAKCLAFVRNDRDELVGVAALKTPQSEYRDRVFAKAHSDLKPSDFALEIGYIHILKEASGHRLSRRLIEALLERAHRRGVFLTTEISNAPIIKFATELGFSQSGNLYRSVEENDRLVLFTHR